MFFPIEHWIENDDDLDEDLCVNDTVIPPQEVGDLIVDDPQVNRRMSWIVVLVLVAVFQTKFRVTDRLCQNLQVQKTHGDIYTRFRIF